MNKELNTLLTTLYVVLDDHILPELNLERSPHCGRRPRLSDAELLCLVVAQQLLQFDSETRWIRFAREHLTGMFPGIPHQSGYNKRVRAAGPLISRVITALAQDTPSWHEVLRLVDSTPLPAGTSRETVKRSEGMSSERHLDAGHADDYHRTALNPAARDEGVSATKSDVRYK